MAIQKRNNELVSLLIPDFVSRAEYEGGPVVNLNSFNYDAGGRQRVSELTTLGEYKIPYQDDVIFYDTVTNGTGASAYDTAVRGMSITTSASGDYVVRQTKQRHNYQSGKSQFAEWTFQDLTPETNITKICGYFSSSRTAPYNTSRDGIYLDSSSSQVVLKVDKGGTNVHTSDPITGVDWSKFTIAIVDFLWLGGSGVRLWLIQQGSINLEVVYAHAGATANVMMDHPNQPIRYEIRQDGAGSGTLKAICAQVSSEGAQNIIGKTYSIDNGFTPVTASSSATLYALKGYRLRSDRLGVVINEQSISTFLTSGNTDFYMVLLLNPTVAGTFTYSNVSVTIGGLSYDTGIQQATGTSANTVTGGFPLFSDYGSNVSNVEKQLQSAIRIGSYIDSTGGPNASGLDHIVLAAGSISGTNRDYLGAIGLLEL